MPKNNSIIELPDGLRLDKNGTGRVVLRSCGAFLASDGGQIGVESNGITTVPVTGKTDNGMEYTDFQFRMLSKSYIKGHSVDFSEGDVLQSAVKLFSTKIFRDHLPLVENSIGVAMNPVWTNSRGVPGVDATYRIFHEFGNGIVKRLMSDPPMLDSTSVGVVYTWRKSHPDMSGMQFYERLGDSVNGQTVRVIVTKILEVPETSIVYSGADPDAKRLWNLGALTDSQGKQFTERQNGDQNLQEQQKNERNYKKEGSMLKIKSSLLKLAGIDNLKPYGNETDGEIEMDQVRLEAAFEQSAESLKKFKEANTQFMSRLAKMIGKDVSKIDSETALTELESLIAEPKKILESRRQETLTVYRQVTGKEASSIFEKMIESSDLEQAAAIHAEYSKKYDELHPVRCKKCGGSELTRASGEQRDIAESDNTQTVSASDFLMR